MLLQELNAFEVYYFKELMHGNFEMSNITLVAFCHKKVCWKYFGFS
jgi:hypothetical protein